MSLAALETPALLLQRDRLEANISRMRAHLQRLGVGLRPHVKTAKCMDVVQLALAGQPGGITVSTLREAEYFFERGVRDILYGVGIAPNKLAHVAALRRRGADVAVVLDSPAVARMVVQQAATHDVVFPVLIEIDSDGHRAGLRAGDPALIETGRLLAAGSGTELRGVMTHAGASYGCRSVGAIREMAERERSAAVACAQQLRQACLPCPVVSVGSTPTATYAERLDGVTEVRAGVYVFFDLVMAGLEVCRTEDIVLSVLTAVIGHQADKGRVLIDAGWMALSRDRGTASQPLDQGYGVVCDVAGTPIPELIVIDTSQEHGIVARRGGGALDVECYPAGTLLRLLPNHACATAAQHAAYQVVGVQGQIAAVWQRFSGW